MLNIIIILLLLILFYQNYNKKEHFNILVDYKKVDKEQEELELLTKILYYIKSFEDIKKKFNKCSNKYDTFTELHQYNTDILNNDKTFISDKLWIQNNKLNFCQDIINKEDKKICLEEKYNERLKHGKKIMKELNNKLKWIDDYKILYSENNIEEKYISNEINSNNIFIIYRLHSLLYELSEKYQLEDDNIEYINLSNLKIKPLLANISVEKLLEILLNINIPSKIEIIIKNIIKENYIKENNIDTTVITKKIMEISKLINGFNIMSCDFISFDYKKN